MDFMAKHLNAENGITIDLKESKKLLAKKMIKSTNYVLRTITLQRAGKQHFVSTRDSWNVE